MTLTKHAKERLAERFKVKSESEIFKLKKKFEKDFFNYEEGFSCHTKTVIWKGMYLKGVFRENTLITVINMGFTPLQALKIKKFYSKKHKQSYRNTRPHKRR